MVSSRIRRCRCGEWYIYGHGSTGLGLYAWRPMGTFAKWLHCWVIIRRRPAASWT